MLIQKIIWFEVNSTKVFVVLNLGSVDIFQEFTKKKSERDGERAPRSLGSIKAALSPTFHILPAWLCRNSSKRLGRE